MVEAEHTIKYSAPVPVTVEDTPEEEPLFDEGEFEETPGGRLKRKGIKNARDELRRKLSTNGVTPGSQLKLSIEKYLHSDTAEGGTWAETEHCTKYPCIEAHITNEDYLDVARKWGVGTYRFTLRMNNKIVTAWDKRISATPLSPQPVIQNLIPGDPTSPQFIIQTTGDGHQVAPVPSFKDIMKAQKEAFKEQLEMAKLMREAYGLLEAPTQQPMTDPEVTLLTFLARDDSVMDKVSKGLLGKIFGKAAEERDEWAGVAMEVVKSGQAAQIISSAINAFFAGFSNLIPKGAPNGQTQMPGQQPAPAHSTQTPQQVAPGDLQQMSMAADGQHPTLEAANTDDPYIQMLTSVITMMSANSSVEMAISTVDGFVLRYPQYRDAIGDQFSADAESLLNAIATIPGCEQIPQLPHAKQWIERFQEKFFPESESEEVEK